MQVREINLTELHLAYEIYKCSKNNITYTQYEDIIYQAVKENYKILLAIANDKPFAYAGVRVQTNIEFKKHLHVDEIVIKNDLSKMSYYKELLLYMQDYAKMNQCHEIIINKIYNLDSLKIGHLQALEERYRILQDGEIINHN